MRSRIEAPAPWSKEETMRTRVLALLLCTPFVAAPGLVMAQDDMARYFADECVSCHQIKKKPIEDKHMTREEWKKAIDKMIQLDKLDPVPSKELQAKLLDWLVSTHGPQ